MSEYSKRELWQWLKAENRYKPPKGETRPGLNRAARRQIARARAR